MQKCVEANCDMKINNPVSSRVCWFLIHFRSQPKEETFRSPSAFDAFGLEESGFLYESSTLLPAVVPCPESGTELHTASIELQEGST